MKKPVDQLIEENARQIVDRFVDEAREHERASRSLTRDEIVDHLFRYLLEMVAVLRAGDVERVESCRTAKRHGEQRWYDGYDLKSVILEYGLLRSVILDVIGKAGEPLRVEDCAPIGHFITVAIADAAVEFMENDLSRVNAALHLAEQAKDARDEVLAIVSHDLKNPLSVVQLSADVLARQLEGADLGVARREVNKGLERIQRASNTMARLIGDLLDLGRARAGELALVLSPADAAELLREALEQAAPLAEPRSIRLVDEQASPPGILVCDRARVLQVLANLLGNAIKFSPDGGVVTLRATCDPGACTFGVHDMGPGITAERLPYVFNRYWQAPDTAAQGTGLGLAIAKAFVELHGGRIWCESAPGDGSSFFFELPRSR